MDFPTDLLQEIFIRLPCKNVAVCKCVCRSWHKLLSHPDFTANYATNSPFTTVLLQQVEEASRLHYVTTSLLQFSQKGELICTPVKPRVLTWCPVIGKQSVYIIGSETGLIFLLLRSKRLFQLRRRCTREKIYFFNTLLEECVQVAENKVLAGAEWWFEYNIGFVPAANVYKILRFSYQSDQELIEAKIFTVGVDSEWRISEDPFAFWFPGSDGANFGGFYHWVPKNEGFDSICTFDFLEEKCSGIPKPIELEKLSSETMKLRVFNDRLSLIDFSDPDKGEIIIWTMEEYGVAESWSKRVILYSLIRGPGIFHAITVLPNGNLVLSLKGSNTFISIDTNKNEVTKSVVVGVDPDSSAVYATKFVPRFYRLKEGTIGEQRRSSSIRRFLCVN